MSIRPIDLETLLASVRKTGHVLIVQEAAETLGVAAELSALITEHAWHYLRAAPKRLTGLNTIVPYAKLEEHFYPTVAGIVQHAQTLIQSKGRYHGHT